MPFAELIGQERAARQLCSLAVSGRLPQALLLSGPRGVGKALAARCLIQAVSCLDPVAEAESRGDACGRCRSCIQIARNRFPDHLTVRPDGEQIKIEQIQEVQEYVSLSPVVGPKRWVVFEEVHRLNNVAANALLKTLEEPPPRVIFILVTHRPNLLPETVLSRCLKIGFSFLSPAAVSRILEHFAASTPQVEERSPVAPAVAAAWSGGSLERARFFTEAENLDWGRRLLVDFSRLPEASPAAALVLAAAAAKTATREMFFYLLDRLLHESLRLAAGCGVDNDEWRESAARLAVCGQERILAWRQRLRDIEDGLTVNLNLELALDAFFLELAVVREER